MKCWIVTEGMAGTENQCLGVCAALGVLPEVKRIGLRWPWSLLSPCLGCERSWTFTGDGMAPPWPDLLIASGRKAVAAARFVKTASGGQTFTVFLQNPRIDPAAFDLVAAPAHDGLTGPNVVVTAAAPNRITPESLSAARQDWAETFARLPAPRVAVLVGGKSRAHALTPQRAGEIALSLEDLARCGHGLMVTMSRRTGAANAAMLRARLQGPGAWVWSGEGPNPYQGMLAWADFILVTEDSVSMASDAATTGKPLYILPLDGGSARLRAFHALLAKRGIARPFDGVLLPFSYERLADSALVARAIRMGMGRRL